MLDQIAQFKPEEWINALSGSDRMRVRQLLENGLTEEQAAEVWLGRTGSEMTFGYGASNRGANYLDSLKRELRHLVCGGSEAYNDLRTQFAAYTQRGATVIVGVISAAIAATINIAAGVIAPVVALLLSAICRVGLNAYCNMDQG